MNSLFLVSSAIHTKHGVFTAEQRLQQTLETFESIKSKVPTAQIVLIESSGKQSITQEESDKMQPHLAGLLNFNQDIQVRQIYDMTDNWDIVKNFTEMVVYAKAFDFILNQQPQILQGIDRVFKMSGRYKLTSDFNIDQFAWDDLKDKYIFAQRKQSQFDPSYTGGLTQQLMSRLWSWPANKTSMVMARYNIMAEDFLGSINIGQYRDIEHLLLKYFSGPYLRELQTIGISGQIGPNGNEVKD